ncbi:hypothetical protein E24_00271 [Faustovirus]|nr:hypothetical protein E24_00271 [Faustovirus]AMN85165.1 hypothetical protein E23_00270 [Faustovirus]QBR99164.1 hypothetical protein [Faustovirus mariensis]
MYTTPAAIPYMKRVCMRWHTIAIKIIRLYKSELMYTQMNVVTDYMIYTSTDQNIMDGFCAIYKTKYIKDKYSGMMSLYLVLSEVSQMCMNKRHGLRITFVKGDYASVDEYSHGSWVKSIPNNVVVGLTPYCSELLIGSKWTLWGHHTRQHADDCVYNNNDHCMSCIQFQLNVSIAGLWKLVLSLKY